MASRTEALARVKAWTSRLSISTKLTMLYGGMLSCVMIISSILMIGGLYMVLYHQAEVELEISIKNCMDGIDEYTDGADDVEIMMHGGDQLERVMFGRPKQRKEDDSSRPRGLMPGVVLRITGPDNEIVYDSNKNYFPNDILDKYESKTDRICFANDKIKVINIRDAILIYHKEGEVKYLGQEYKFDFYNTITAEYALMKRVQYIAVIVNILGLFLALGIGYLFIRRAIRPIGELTEAAKSIEVSNLSQRLAVSPANDEIAEMGMTFNRMLDRIQEGFAAQQRFVSDASHELRTPVTVISGYADMLSRWGSKDPEILGEAIGAIRTTAADMSELIENLLFLARTDQKRQIINKVPMEMEPLVAGIFRDMQMATDKHEISMLKNEDAIILGDKVTIKQMLLVFLENAIKYTPAGGHITISSERLGGFLKLEIADDGIGIAKEDHQKIFQRFYRADSSRTKGQDSPGGTGLGLSIAQWIADSHDIGISVESEIGQGTKFILMIPCYNEIDSSNSEEVQL